MTERMRAPEKYLIRKRLTNYNPSKPSAIEGYQHPTINEDDNYWHLSQEVRVEIDELTMQAVVNYPTERPIKHDEFDWVGWVSDRANIHPSDVISSLRQLVLFDGTFILSKERNLELNVTEPVTITPRNHRSER